MKICPKCETKNEDSAASCYVCRTPFQAVQTAPPPSLNINFRMDFREKSESEAQEAPAPAPAAPPVAEAPTKTDETPFITGDELNTFAIINERDKKPGETKSEPSASAPPKKQNPLLKPPVTLACAAVLSVLVIIGFIAESIALIVIAILLFWGLGLFACCHIPKEKKLFTIISLVTFWAFLVVMFILIESHSPKDYTNITTVGFVFCCWLRVVLYAVTNKKS